MKKKETVKKGSNFNKEVASAKKKAKASLSDARKKLLKAEKDVEKFVEHNPKKAVAIAVGIGAAIGTALTTIAKHKKK